LLGVMIVAEAVRCTVGLVASKEGFVIVLLVVIEVVVVPFGFKLDVSVIGLRSGRLAEAGFEAACGGRKVESSGNVFATVSEEIPDFNRATGASVLTTFAGGPAAGGPSALRFCGGTTLGVVALDLSEVITFEGVRDVVVVEDSIPEALPPIEESNELRY
jgi:hypothetical protein